MFVGKRLGKCSACIGCPKLSTKPGQQIAIEADNEILINLEQFSYDFIAGRAIDLNDMPALLWRLWVLFKSQQDMYDRAAKNRMCASLEALGMLR